MNSIVATYGVISTKIKISKCHRYVSIYVTGLLEGHAGLHLILLNIIDEAIPIK